MARSNHDTQMAVRSANYLPRTKNGLIPNAVFARTNRTPTVTHIHTFGCPAYVLMQELQSNKKIYKWKPRCKVGIYLGPSHTSTLHFILSSSTDNILLQFHVSFYDLFETVNGDNIKILSEWQINAGLIATKSISFVDEIAGRPETVHQRQTNATLYHAQPQQNNQQELNTSMINTGTLWNMLNKDRLT